MRRRDLDYIVMVAMLASGLYVTITGLVADFLDLHQFFLHRYAGYLCAASSVLHIALNWRRAMSYARGLSRRVRQPGRPTEERAGEEPVVGRRQILLAALSAAGGFLVGWLLGGFA